MNNVLGLHPTFHAAPDVDFLASPFALHPTNQFRGVENSTFSRKMCKYCVRIRCTNVAAANRSRRPTKRNIDEIHSMDANIIGRKTACSTNSPAWIWWSGIFSIARHLFCRTNISFRLFWCRTSGIAECRQPSLTLRPLITFSN